MLALTPLLAAALLGAPAAQPALQFDRERIGTATYEASCMCDVNNDGNTDIVSGGFWYPGPDFKQGHKICDILAQDTYYDDFSDYPMDVNGDGYVDIVTGGWWGKTLQWRENPKGQPVEWKTHDIAEVGNIERGSFYDLDGDGFPEALPVTKPVYIFRLKRDAEGKGTGEFEKFAIEKGGGGHGLGCGDVNGDGRPDVILPGGWLECPQDPYDVDNWTWHDEFKLGGASVPIPVHDVNGDGLADLIVGEAHNYGLYWLEQGKEDGKRTWTKHMIDEDRSQYHDLQLFDIDNDSVLELVTGKRYHAHNGHDPGAEEPLGLYYFEINGGNFERVTLDYGPADQASGAGIYFWVEDIDKNGWKDILAPGKEGLHLFRNQGPKK